MLIGEAVADIEVEVTSFGVRSQKALVTSGGNIEVSIDLTAAKDHVEQVPLTIIRDRSQ
jgi:hypothetical protein